MAIVVLGIMDYYIVGGDPFRSFMTDSLSNFSSIYKVGSIKANSKKILVSYILPRPSLLQHHPNLE